MKFLLFIAFSLAMSPISSLACDLPKDAAQTVVMVDYNFILQEVEAAKKAACEQGKNFVVLPHGYDTHKELGALREEEYRTESYGDNANCFGEAATSERCKALSEKYVKIKKTLKTRIEELSKTPSEELVEKKIKDLAENNIAVSSVVLSGHDGSGHFHGHAGSGSKFQMVDMLKGAYEGKPELLEQLNSVFLWGCYTATASETEWWSEQLESLNIVAGFNGSGPSIGKRASHEILYDLMSSQKEIARIEEADRMEAALKNLDGLNYLYSGIYVRNCNKKAFYLKREKKPGSFQTLETSFRIAGRALCRKYVDKNNEYHERYMKYFTGELPIPEDTHNGELREIYNFSRSWEHCAKYWDPAKKLEPDHVALLLFFEGVKGNFYNAFEEYIEDAYQAIKSLPAGELDFIGKGKSFFDWLPEKLKYEASSLASPEEHAAVEKFARKYKDLLANMPRDKESFVNLSRKDINRYNMMLSELSGSELYFYPGVRKKVGSIKKLQKALNVYAYSLDPNCMSMLSWHEDIGADLSPRSFAHDSCKID